MSGTGTPSTLADPGAGPGDRLEALFAELSQLCGQRNAIDGRIVDIVAEIDHDQLWGATGARSVAALVAWKTGATPGNAATIAAVAHRSPQFPHCTQGMREGRLSLDQVGVIAGRAANGSDTHYAQLAQYATVTQLRTAVALEPRPDPDPKPPPEPSITKRGGDDGFDYWRLTLPHADSAIFDAALASHRDALITAWKHTHTSDDSGGGQRGDFEGAGLGDEQAPAGRPPMPTTLDAFLRLISDGWDAEATRRPHGQRTTVVIHLDLAARIAALHLGPLLSDADRRYLTCEATCEVWFERNGQPIGCGRSTRTINRRLRRALEHRDKTCVVPGCGATRGLHCHHLVHWEDGGPTELENLVMLCPRHHRMHHQGLLGLTGPASRLVVTDSDGRTLTSASLARPPSGPPPNVPPYPGPTGERADWWWYTPFQPQPPPAMN